LSGGERQMLAIGRALMSKPSLLMMDEPTAGLAPKIVEMMGRIIDKMNQDGISIFLVEQNAELALRLARYGYVLERGLITLEGPTDQLRDNEEVKKAYLGM
jgi:branched-chain amino acid transport system ATP-binding protein